MLWFFLLIFLFIGGIAWLAWGYLRQRETVQHHVRFLPTATHGVLDYMLGGLLAVAPWLLGFAAGGAETWVPVAVGVGIVCYSLFTDYEWGMVRRLSMPVHLVLDGVSGLILFASPMLFGFYDEVLDPHLGLGMLVMVVALVTQPEPSDRDTTVNRSVQERSGASPSSSRANPSVNEGGHEE